MTNPHERLRHHVTGAIERGEAKPLVEQLSERDAILEALSKFIRQKPGMDSRNYDYAGYNAERRSVYRDLQHAERLLAAVRWRTSIGADSLKAALKGAFSGRLSWNDKDDGPGLSYCTGQYFPTEYRKAACAVLAAALWEYWREGYPAGTHGHGPAIRKSARKEFGLEIAKRYFDYRASDYKR